MGKLGEDIEKGELKVMLSQAKVSLIHGDVMPNP
jgi:hypothetical protein